MASPVEEVWRFLWLLPNLLKLCGKNVDREMDSFNIAAFHVAKGRHACEFLL